MKVGVGAAAKVYPVLKLAALVEALEAEGLPTDKLIQELGISRAEVSSPTTSLSLHQLLQACLYADKVSRDPYFAYHAGLRMHVSAYGMYGFAILSGTDYRQIMAFAESYHQLATPLADIAFTEGEGVGTWTFSPLPDAPRDSRIYKFIVEMQFGLTTSLFRDIMGHTFGAREFRVTFDPPDDAARYEQVFGAPVLFRQSENAMLYDAGWLDGAPRLGNEVTYRNVVGLCDAMIEEFRLHAGMAGKVRRELMMKLMRPTNIGDVANALNTSIRTLSRKLREENTSFREVADELRKETAVRYLRDTELTVEGIAELLGFSDAANFRHAFRRWTSAAPSQFRGGRGTT
jgi:AraC-like DNA-binding protein